MKQEEYGQIVSTKDALLSEAPGATAPAGSSIVTESGNALWSYRNEGRINGIPVAEKDCSLPIDREDLLQAAFQLTSTPRSLIFWMSPDDEDAIKAYDSLLKRAADGSVLIQDEQKQYDAAKGKFIVWIRYNEVCYTLHPRYTYLYEEQKNG